MKFVVLWIIDIIANFYFAAGCNSLPRSLTNTSEDYNTSIDSSTQIDNSSVLETLIEDQEIITPKSKIH